jgi:hypothetical protein
MKFAVLFAFIGAASCLEVVSLGGKSYSVGPDNLVPRGMPVSGGGVTYYVTDADYVADADIATGADMVTTRMSQKKMMGGDVQEFSIGGVSYFVEPEFAQMLVGLPASEQIARIQNAEMATAQMSQKKSMDRNMQEFSIGGVSYLVEPKFALSLVGLPASEQIARIQEAESTDRMPRSMERNMEEFSIDGVSYFVEPEFALTLVGLPASEQIALIQEADMMERMPRMMQTETMERMPRMTQRMPRSMDRNMEEFSIDGVSYFVEPEFALTLVGLPASEQIALIQEAEMMERMPRMTQMETMERMPRMLTRSGNMKEVTVGGVSYFIEPQLADALVGRPASEQLALIQGTQRMPRILTTGVASGNMQELSIGGVSYFVEPQFAEQLVNLPASEQLARLQGTKKVPRMLKKATPRTVTRTRSVRSLAGKQEINIDGRSYFVDKTFSNKLASMPRVQQIQLLRQIKSTNKGASYGY